jgi:hypothetical protein
VERGNALGNQRQRYLPVEFARASDAEGQPLGRTLVRRRVFVIIESVLQMSGFTATYALR